MSKTEDVIRWVRPISNVPGVPVGTHPGAFGTQRKHDVHTGVDLYCNEGDGVYSCTDGLVVEVGEFTGPSAGDSWWNDTKAIVIDTGLNYIVYGELEPLVDVGQRVSAGEVIGKITPVLPPHKHRPDIAGHSVNMLHLELMTRRFDGFIVWILDESQPNGLLDPTSELLRIYEKELTM